MQRILPTLSLTAALIMGAASSAFAQTAMSGSSMHHSMMMPHCSSGNPVVMVNTKDKTYSMADKSHMAMMHKSGMMMHKSGMTDKEMMMKNHMSMMCKSKADAMGAHMMKSSMKGSM